MKKLKLPVDALRVESYATSHATPAAEGTVHGHVSVVTRFGYQTCAGMSCDYACVTLYDNTCRYVCY